MLLALEKRDLISRVPVNDTRLVQAGDMFQTAIPVIQVSGSIAAEEFYCRGLGFTLLSSWRLDETKDDPRTVK